eukprot:12412880-Karenia_brevis.AAC.1
MAMLMMMTTMLMTTTITITMILTMTTTMYDNANDECDKSDDENNVKITNMGRLQIYPDKFGYNPHRPQASRKKVLRAHRQTIV